MPVCIDADNAFGCNSSIASGSFQIDQSSINEASRLRFNNAIANNTLNQIQIISTAPRLSDISMPVEVIDTPLPEEFTDAYITAFQDIQESLETLSLPLAGGLSGRFDEPLDSSNSPKKIEVCGVTIRLSVISPVGACVFGSRSCLGGDFETR